MKLSPAERLYVEKRERLTKLWPAFGAGVLLMLAALALWLWLRVPYFANPWAVAEALESGGLPESTITLMAAMLPVVVLMFLVFALAVVLLTFVAFSNERRLIQLVRREGAALEDSEAD